MVRNFLVLFVFGGLSDKITSWAFPTLPRKSLSSRHSFMEASDQPEALLMSYVEIAKPMGLVLEEITAGDPAGGVRVAYIDPTGNAGAASIGDDPSECLLVHDRILAVDQKQCMDSSFEEVMELIASAPGPRVQLTVGRGEGVTIVAWPNGIGVGARPGDSMRDLAKRAYYKVNYSCESGGCGTCEQMIMLDDGSTRYVRNCIARVPKESQSVLVKPSDRLGV